MLTRFVGIDKMKFFYTLENHFSFILTKYDGYWEFQNDFSLSYNSNVILKESKQNWYW